MNDRITVREAWRGITPGCGKCLMCPAEARWSKRTKFPDGGLLIQFFCDAHKPFVKIEAQPLPWERVTPPEHGSGCSCCDCLCDDLHGDPHDADCACEACYWADLGERARWDELNEARKP